MWKRVLFPELCIGVVYFFPDRFFSMNNGAHHVAPPSYQNFTISSLLYLLSLFRSLSLSLSLCVCVCGVQYLNE